MIASSMALAIGTLRIMPAESGHSVRSHCALPPSPRPAGGKAWQFPDAAVDRPLGIKREPVAAAFDEGDARLHRVARERLQRENERAFHEAMDQEAMRIWIDVGDAAMAALEMQPVRRDGAVEEMERGPRRTGSGRIGRVGDGPPHSRLELRRLAIADERQARDLAPFRHR